jgi:O-antigen ligase
MAVGTMPKGKSREIVSGSIWFPVALLVFIFLTGGASRADVQSLPLLRFVCAAAFVFLLILRGPRLFGELHRPALFLGAIALLVLIQLVPLPPSIWTAIPGRAFILSIEAAAGIESPWRPLAIVPEAAWNGLFSLIVPAAVLAAMALAGRQADRLILDTLLILIGVGALIGVLQLLGVGALYFYALTNADSSVGFLANRNHHALLLACAFPLLAARLSMLSMEEGRLRGTLVVGFAFAAILVPLIVVVGSRAGLLLGVAGIISFFLVYRRPSFKYSRRSRSERRMDEKWVALGFGVAAVAASFFTSRLTAFDRLAGVGASESDRSALVPVVWEMITDFMPFGAGAGSFPRLFQKYEPIDFLNPTYYNHVHNDVLETLLDFGVAGGVLMALAVIAWVRSAARITHVFRQSPERSARIYLGVAGLVVMALCATGSLFDYPLRTPLMASVLVVAVVWVVRAVPEQPSR